jgi:retinol-binding protein 3
MNYEEVETTVRRLQCLISDKYVFPEVAEEICEHIGTKLESQIYKSITTREDLANILTKDMQSINRDRHLSIQVNENLAREINQSVESERSQDEPERPNAGFEEISILDGNVGYLKLTEFADTKYAGDIAVDAMQQLVGCDSLIFDLRENSATTYRT